MARRYTNPNSPASQFAAAWNQLPEWHQQELISQVQAALREVKAAADGEAPERGKPKAPQYKRHVRFSEGNMTVLNSVRSVRSDDAWSALAETARNIQQGKGR